MWNITVEMEKIRLQDVWIWKRTCVMQQQIPARNLRSIISLSSIFPAKKERCSGVEALVRWNSGKMGMVGPGEFIPLAEYLGLINPIGDFVLRKACEKCKYWNDMGHPEYRINVNLSVVQLLQNDIVERIRTVLEETKMRPENLTLEVTESLAINDIGRMKKVLSKDQRAWSFDRTG